MKWTLAALFLALSMGGPALAQDASASSEFGRVSGGTLHLGTKSPSALSGSLTTRLPLRSGFEAMLAGTVVKDRLWFFTSVQQFESSGLRSESFNVKAGAELGARHSLGASLSQGDYPVASTPSTAPLAVPSSFLSLRYTGIVSSNMFFTASVSRSSTTQRTP